VPPVPGMANLEIACRGSPLPQGEGVPGGILNNFHE
jgi:hypothetical protein